ncbi:MAG: VOC family protein [Euryarchaeota archaeon]|nr:VOC family protein [Euryarchaeota archaeon]
MQKVIPYLWFKDQAEEAAGLYVSVFKNSRVLDIVRYGDAGPGPKGTAMLVAFQLEGQEFFALNGGDGHQFTPAISFLVDCRTQAEVDHYWEKLSEGGEKGKCGWLKDRYGLSWQVVPTVLGKMLQDKDPDKAARVMHAMLQMTKLDIALLMKAYDGV